ncbi:MAG: hypothetical protein IMZ64_01755 [Bacteroidetes bacterium]|nr:hypothetical protein [Bacteroidota bacterium]
MEHYGNMEFATKKELFKFLSENRDKLIAQKKAVKKEVDCGVIVNPILVFDAKTAAKKAEGQIIDPINLDSLKVVCVINTTNFLDSHMDVHLPGIWNKSILDNKHIMHLQEHNMEFEKIIADGDNLKAYTKRFKWSELGYGYPGETEALMFDSEILRKRNEFMLTQYANGWVKNHSIGMHYVKTDFAINDEDYPNEFEAWKKYYPMIANPEMADERGYFWYVIEAKCVEGSAVPIGSNTATPTLDNGTKSINEENIQDDQPSIDTENPLEPDKSTLKTIDYEFLIKNLKN